MEITDQILNDAEALYNFHASFCRPPIRSDLIFAAGSHDMKAYDFSGCQILNDIYSRALDLVIEQQWL